MRCLLPIVLVIILVACLVFSRFTSIMVVPTGKTGGPAPSIHDGVSKAKKNAIVNNKVPVPTEPPPKAPRGTSEASLEATENPSARGDQPQEEQQDPSPPAAAPLLPPAKPKEMMDKCCQSLESLKEVLLSLPGDITNLLPILHAYYAEPDMDTIVEAGSRGGSSTTFMLESTRIDPKKKRCATMDLIITKSVKSLYECERKCMQGRDLDQGFVMVEGNDLVAPIPFVDEASTTTTPKGSRPIDAMFIDTLHNGDLLWMELIRFPKYVRKYLLFHDSYLFRTIDENANVKAVGFEEKEASKSFNSVRPIGLHPSLQKFLDDPKCEWEEEMNNIHNNGLLILRRKTVRPTKPTSLYPGKKLEDFPLVRSLILQTSKKGTSGTLAVPAEKLETLCKSHYKDMTGGKDQTSKILCWKSNDFHKETSFRGLYHALIAKNQRPSSINKVLVPQPEIFMAPLLPLLMSHAVASPKKRVLFVGCSELAPFIAVAHGTSFGGSKLHAACPGKEGKILTFRANYTKQHAKDYISLEDLAKDDSSSSLGTFHVIVASATALKEHGKAIIPVLMKLADKGRIVVYGLTTLAASDIESITKKLSSSQNKQGKFVLKQSLLLHGGLQMWESTSQTDMLYVPGAKKHSV